MMVRADAPVVDLSGGAADVLYLHFLNRELLRSLGVVLAPREALEAIDILLLGTTARFAATIAFLWESGLIFGPRSSRLAMLMLAGDLEVISEYPTVREFVAACQRLYAFDRQRYEVYFSAASRAGQIFQPTSLKTESTTQFLDTNLSLLGDELVVPEIAPLVHSDKVAIVRIAKSIAQVVQRREERAITLSLFDTALSKTAASPLPLARLLSGLHLAHYLKFTRATIPTGIPHVLYFDSLARGFPRQDVVSLRMVFDLIGFNVHIRQQLCGVAEAWRHQHEHTAFVHLLQYLTCGLYYQAAADESAGAVRLAFAGLLRRLGEQARTDRWLRRGTTAPSLGSGLDRLSFLARIAERHPRFAEYTERHGRTLLSERRRLLILTATNVEIDELIRSFGTRGHGYEREFSGAHTLYHFGVYQATEIIAVQSEMGTESPSAMTLTALDVVDAIRPDYMILVGIGFGLKPNEQQLGDIMVSRELRLYDPQKVTVRGRRSHTIPRGGRPPASPLLLDRARGARTEWQHSAVHVGLMWTSNTLVNSPTFVRKLKRLEPDAIGGEMEGAGVYCVGAKRKVDWIVIKAIADWGMGKDDKEQARAAANAIAFVMLMLDQGGLAAIHP